MPDQSDSNLPPLRKDKLIVDAGGGSVPPDIRVMIDDLAEVLGAEVVEGTILPCQVCEFFECVCELRKTHKETCRFRKAMECYIAIPCAAHQEEVCQICDACDCGGIR